MATVRINLDVQSSGDAKIGQVSSALKELDGQQGRASSSAGKFAESVSRVSTTLARSAPAFNLNVAAMRAIDDVADVATLAFGNLTSAVAGFNVASVAAAGAGFAVGWAIGKQILQINGAADAYEELARQALDYFGLLEKYSGPSGQGFTEKMAASNKLAVEKQIATLRALGMSVDDIAKHYQHFSDVQENAQTAAMRAIEKLLKEEERRKKAIQDAEEAVRKYAQALELVYNSNLRAINAQRESVGDTYKQNVIIITHLLEQEAEAEKKIAEAAQKAHEVALANAEAEKARDMAILAGKHHLAEALLELGQIAGGVFGVMATLGGGLLKVITNLSDATIRGASAWEKWANAAATAAAILGGPGGGRGGLMGLVSGAAAGAAWGWPGAIIGGAVGGILGLFGGGGQQRAQQEAFMRQQQEDARRMAESARQQRAAGLAALPGAAAGYFMSHTITTAEDARRQGALFAAAWGQVVKEKGIIAAADAFKDAFAKMKADMEAAGVDLPEWFTQIGTLIDLGLDEKFRAIAEGADAAAKFLKALAESGVAGKEIIAAFEEEARRAFEEGRRRALELGLTPEQAIKAGFGAANPLLKELLNQSILSRQTLSKDIQDMIDAAGIVPDVDFQQLDELRHIRAAVEALAGVGGGPRTPPTGPPSGPPGDPATDPGDGRGRGRNPPPAFGQGGPRFVVVRNEIGGRHVEELVVNAVTGAVFRNGTAVSYLKRAVTGRP